MEMDFWVITLLSSRRCEIWPKCRVLASKSAKCVEQQHLDNVRTFPSGASTKCALFPAAPRQQLRQFHAKVELQVELQVTLNVKLNDNVKLKVKIKIKRESLRNGNGFLGHNTFDLQQRRA